MEQITDDKVTFQCRVCGRSEIVCVWNPMLVTEICGRCLDEE